MQLFKSCESRVVSMCKRALECTSHVPIELRVQLPNSRRLISLTGSQLLFNKHTQLHNYSINRASSSVTGALPYVHYRKKAMLLILR
jgi:hypothetical protein